MPSSSEFGNPEWANVADKRECFFLLALMEDRRDMSQYDLLQRLGISPGASIPALNRLRKEDLVTKEPGGARRRQAFKHASAGSTKETNESRARKIAALKFADACERGDPLPRKTPTLLAASNRFLEWVEEARLSDKTKTYYRDGWRSLKTTSILGLRLDSINNDVAQRLSFSGSAPNTNCALRTLRRLLHKAEDWRLIGRAPRIKLVPEKGCSLCGTQ